MEDSNQSIDGTAIGKIITVLNPLDESGRVNVLNAVNAYYGFGTNQRVAISDLKESAKDSGQIVNTTQKDIRSFKEEKQPKTAIEMAAVMAYYLKELAPPEERKESITLEDVKKYFIAANYRGKKQLRYTLHNAKNAGYFESLGKGKFKLNSVGINLVANNLPKSHKQRNHSSKRKKKSKPNINKKKKN